MADKISIEFGISEKKLLSVSVKSKKVLSLHDDTIKMNAIRTYDRRAMMPNGMMMGMMCMCNRNSRV